MMKEGNNWVKNLAEMVFEFRYGISLTIAFEIAGAGAYLYGQKGWHFKDVAQVCTGFFIVITLFFSALNYEFAANKMKRDYKAARELLTYSTATEWYKPPLNEYQKTCIRYERLFRQSHTVRDAQTFETFLDHPAHLEYKESLKGILNALEALAAGVHRGLIDKDFIREFYGGIYRIYYTDYIVYIQQLRMTKNDKNLWVNFTSLAEEWHGQIDPAIANEDSGSSFITS